MFHSCFCLPIWKQGPYEQGIATKTKIGVLHVKVQKNKNFVKFLRLIYRGLSGNSVAWIMGYPGEESPRYNPPHIPPCKAWRMGGTDRIEDFMHSPYGKKIVKSLNPEITGIEAL